MSVYIKTKGRLKTGSRLLTNILQRRHPLNNVSLRYLNTIRSTLLLRGRFRDLKIIPSYKTYQTIRTQRKISFKKMLKVRVMPCYKDLLAIPHILETPKATFYRTTGCYTLEAKVVDFVRDIGSLDSKYNSSAELTSASTELVTKMRIFYGEMLLPVPMNDRKLLLFYRDQTYNFNKEYQKLLIQKWSNMGGCDQILHPRHEDCNRATKVLNRLKKSCPEIKNQKFRIIIINAPDIFSIDSLLTGTIFLSKTVLDSCDDDELAFILGHEMCHTIMSHKAEELSLQVLYRLFMINGADVLNRIHPFNKNVNINQQLEMGVIKAMKAEVDSLYPNKFIHELEADRIGMILMARAQYNPESAVKLMAQFHRNATMFEGDFDPDGLGDIDLVPEEEEVEKIFENLHPDVQSFISKNQIEMEHPPTDERQEIMANQLESALQIRDKAKKNRCPIM